MFLQKHESFALNNFEGTLDFLIYLIQKEEMCISDVILKELTHQCLNKLIECQQDRKVEMGADLIGTAAHLLLLKSKNLLPNHEEESEVLAEEIEDPNFDIIYHLIDYCRFKEAAKLLTKRQDEQDVHFFRGIVPVPEYKKPLGINHISLDELSLLFKEMINRAQLAKPKIYEENWKVSDKMKRIRQMIQGEQLFSLNLLFSSEGSRMEWIVTFLALLELMKIGEVGVGRENGSENLVVFAILKEV